MYEDLLVNSNLLLKILHFWNKIFRSRCPMLSCSCAHDPFWSIFVNGDSTMCRKVVSKMVIGERSDDSFVQLLVQAESKLTIECFPLWLFS